jgi:hypothetical protein
MFFLIENKISNNELAEFCKRNYVKKLSIFGSAIRNEMNPNSDIDLLVEFEKNHVPGLIHLAGMENELSDLLGYPVDLRTPQELSRYFRDEIIKTAEVQYERK